MLKNAINFIKERSESRKETLDKEGWHFAFVGNKIPVYKKEGWPDLLLSQMQSMTDDDFYVFICPPYLKSEAKDHVIFSNILEELGEVKEPEFPMHCEMNEEVWDALLNNGYDVVKRLPSNSYEGNMKRNCDYAYIQIIPLDKKFYPTDVFVNGSSAIHVDDYLKKHLRKRNPKQS